MGQFFDYVIVGAGSAGCVLVTGIRLAREILSAPARAGVVDGELWPGTEAETDDEPAEFARRRAETLYHPVGTCRMGPHPADSVVDPEQRVHEIDGLRVVDASVVPRIVGGNTNAPTIMIAERAVELVNAR